MAARFSSIRQQTSLAFFKKHLNFISDLRTVNTLTEKKGSFSSFHMSFEFLYSCIKYGKVWIISLRSFHQTWTSYFYKDNVNYISTDKVRSQITGPVLSGLLICMLFHGKLELFFHILKKSFTFCQNTLNQDQTDSFLKAPYWVYLLLKRCRAVKKKLLSFFFQWTSSIRISLVCGAEKNKIFDLDAKFSRRHFTQW